MAKIMEIGSDACQIRWRLLPTCPNGCKHCSHPTGDGNFILTNSRLRDMVQKLHALPAPSLDISFTGGEPAQHPLFADIVTSTLTTNKKIHINIETVGRQKAQFFIDLAKGVPSGALTIVLSIHPAKADLKELLIFMAALAENHVDTKVRLFRDDTAPEATEQFISALVKFESVFHLPFVEIYSQGTEPTAELNTHNSARGTGAADTPLIEIIEVPPEDHPQFCVLGVNTLRIEPDARFFGAFCPHAPASPPLWQMPIRHGLGIVKCPVLQRESRTCWAMPRFSTYAEATDFLRQYKRQVNRKTGGPGQRVPLIACRQPRPMNDCSCALSVLVTPAPDLASLSETISSLWLQQVDKLEIILLHEDDDPKMADACAGIASRYPDVVVVKPMGRGVSLLEAAAHMSHGKFVTALNGGDVLVAHALARGLEAMGETGAAVAVLAVEEKNASEIGSTLIFSPGVYTGNEALQALFEENWGAGRLMAMIWDRTALCEQSLMNRNIDTFLALLPVLRNGKTIVLNNTGYIAKTGSKSKKVCARDSAHNNGDLAVNLELFYSLAEEYELPEGLRQSGLQWLKAIMQPLLQNLGSQGAADGDKWAVLASYPDFVKLLIDDVADLATGTIWKRSALSDLDAGPTDLALQTLTTPAAVTPELSLILEIPADIGPDDGRLADIACAVPGDTSVEVILLIAGSNAQETQAWQTVLPSPFWRPLLAPQRASRESLRRAALGAARAEKVAFWSWQCPIDMEFFQAALEIPASSDMAFLVPRNEQAILGDGPHGAIEITKWLLEQLAAGESCARIYRRDFLRKFPLPGDLPQLLDDNAFVLEAVQRASNIFVVKYAGLSTPTVESTANGQAHLWRVLSMLAPTVYKNFPAQCVAIMRRHFLSGWGNSTPDNEDDYYVEQLAEHAAFGAALTALYKDAKLSPGGVYRWRRPSYDGAPLVSVIVPVYNQEDYLARALDSILNQSLTSLEVIVINDASTDATLTVCRACSSRDPRIKVIDLKENHGQGYARNLALGVALGQFITFVDADDYLLPGFLLSATAQLLQNPEVDYVQGGKVCKEVKKAGKDADRGEKVYSLYPQRRIITGSEMIALYLAEETEYWECWGKLYRKDFLINNDLKFGEHLFEDDVFLQDAYAAAGKLLIDPAPCYVYEKKAHPDSAMKPVKWTHRHLDGFLARCAEVSDFVRRRPDLNPDGLVGWRKLTKVYEYFRPLLLGYLHRQGKAEVTTITEKDLENLVHAPDFMRIFLEDYAAYNVIRLQDIPELVQDQSPPKAQRLEELLTHKEPTRISVIALVDSKEAVQELAQWLPSQTDQEDVELILVGLNRDATDQALDSAFRHRQIQVLRGDRTIPAGTAFGQALAYASGSHALLYDGQVDLPPLSLKEALAAYPLAQAIYLGKLPSVPHVPEGLTSAQEACAIVLEGNSGAVNLGGWLLATDLLSPLVFPAANYAAGEILARALLSARDCVWANRGYRSETNPSRTRPKPPRTSYQQALARMSHMAATLARIEHHDVSEYLAKAWIKSAYAGENGLREPFLAHILSYKGGKTNPAIKDAVEVLASFKLLLRFMLTDCAELWGQGKGDNANKQDKVEA